MNTISKSDNIIDSRDIIARISELESDRDSLSDAWKAYKIATTDPQSDQADLEAEEPDTTLAEWLEGDDGLELKALLELAEEASGYTDWQHGEALINDDYFEEYAQDLAEDIYGKELKASTWPFSCIDWEQAAAMLKDDYTSVDFDGQTFWIRS